jgi:hypothetical protein
VSAYLGAGGVVAGVVVTGVVVVGVVGVVVGAGGVVAGVVVTGVVVVGVVGVVVGAGGGVGAGACVEYQATIAITIIMTAIIATNVDFFKIPPIYKVSRKGLKAYTVFNSVEATMCWVSLSWG